MLEGLVVGNEKKLGRRGRGIWEVGRGSLGGCKNITLAYRKSLNFTMNVSNKSLFKTMLYCVLLINNKLHGHNFKNITTELGGRQLIRACTGRSRDMIQ